jgi:hypothetical protein
MSSSLNSNNRPASREARKFSWVPAKQGKTRKASVLLLVIVILLILSILGTAYISTSHIDRLSSQQTLLNIQSDANFDGILKSAAGLITDDLNNPLDNFRGITLSIPSLGYVGFYNAATTYTAGQVVNDPNNPGNYYQAVVTSTGAPLTNTSDWSPTSPSATSPYRGTFRGPWLSSVAYNPGDIVYVSGPPEAFYYGNNPTASPTGQPGMAGSTNWALVIGGHVPFTSASVQTWIASRIPSVIRPDQPLTGNTGGGAAPPNNQPYWANFSHSINSTTGNWQSVLGFPFESPDGSTMVTLGSGVNYYPGYATLNGVTVPTLSDATIANFPQTPPLTPMPVVTAGAPHTVIAADADGDGVADSLLFRIPGANYDGLTWYAGIRIIDNNSAINVNTAWTRDSEYSYPSGGGNVTLLSNWGFFPTSVGLLELLNRGASATAPPTYTGGDIIPTANVPVSYPGPATSDLIIAPPFNTYRFNYSPVANQPQAGQISATYTGFGVPLDEMNSTVNPPQPWVEPNVTQRDGDFVYISQSDAFYHGLITRIDNPGYNSFTPGAPAVGLARYQAIPFGDAAALAYHFGLPNPNSGTTLLESLLPVSLSDYQNNRGIAPNPAIAAPVASLSSYTGVNTSGTHTNDYLGVSCNNNYTLPTTPYGGNPLTDIGAWWYENYDYSMLASGNTVPNYMPLRSLLTTRNPVSNYITPVYDSGPPGEVATIDPDQPMDTLAMLQQTSIQNGALPLPAPLGKAMLPYYDNMIPSAEWTPWNKTATYNVGQIVQFGGIFYVSLITGNTDIPPAIYTGSNITGYNSNSWGTWGQFKGVWNQNAVYRFNDIVVDPTDGNTYISLNDDNQIATAPHTLLTSGALHGYPANLAYWQRQSISQHPVKTNVNTATFRELYRAFWSVMSGNPANSCPFGQTPANAASYQTAGTYDHPYETTNPTAINIPWHMFRSVVRDPTAPIAAAVGGPYNMPTNFMDPTNVMALRAALAAVNTLGLRDQTQNIISRTIWLTTYIGNVPTAVEARVYSAVSEPIITEVYADNDETAPNVNLKGYVAIELYNPYNYPLAMKNWQAGIIYRPNAGGTYPVLSLLPVAATGVAYTQMLNENTAALPSDATNPVNSPALNEATNAIAIPAHGYALLENYDGGSNSGTPDGTYDAKGRAISSGLPQAGVYTGTNNNTVDVYVPGLSKVIQDVAPNVGGEFVLLRPRRQDGSYTVISNTNSIYGPNFAGYDPLNEYNEGTPTGPNLYDLVPVDSYDFTGLIQTTTPSSYEAWSYIRANGNAEAFVGTYPGQYIGTNGALTTPRQTGTDPAPYISGPTNPFTFPHTPNFSPAYNATPPQVSNYPGPTTPLQIYNSGMAWTGGSAFAAQTPGPNPTITPQMTSVAPTVGGSNAAPQKFPFGGFARNGDILNVPYIGSYRLRVVTPSAAIPYAPSNPAQDFLELNSLPMDASLADDGDTNDDTYENVGRFGPLTSATNIPAQDWYGWSARLFDYLTVQSNNSQNIPNVDPGFNDAGTDPTGTNQPTYPYANVYWPGSQSPSPLTYTTPYPTYTTPPPAGYVAPTGAAAQSNLVFASDATAPNQTTQDNVGVDGLININTANWKVLSMLPFVTPADDAANWASDNELIAQAIVAWRDGNGLTAPNGPFASIFDLNKVTANLIVAGAPITVAFQNADGKFPAGSDPTVMGVTGNADTNFTAANNGAGVASGIVGDYRADNMVLNRISNLITTRSDTFTVYIVIEGWQNPVITPNGTGLAAGAPIPTPPPALKVIKRFAFIADRSQINSDLSTRFLKTLVIQNN